jgi:hypothetical protein
VNRVFRVRFALVGLSAIASQSLAPAAAAFAAPSPAKQTSTLGTGYDVSYPQCTTQLPKNPAFGIVGVNGGLPYAANSCLSTEYQWSTGATSTSQPHTSFYLNTANPGPTASTHWPPAGTTTPQACDGSWSQSCAYDYGWYAAQDSFSRAAASAGNTAASAAPWWLDVETANSWSTDTSTNSADLQGAVAALKSAGVANIGVYSTTSMWSQITGATTPGSIQNQPFSGLADWLPGARSARNAQTFCGARGFSGGVVKLVQYSSGGFDADYAC